MFALRQWVVVEFEHPLVPLQLVIARGPGPDAQLGHLGRHGHLIPRGERFAAQPLFFGQVERDAQVAGQLSAGVAHGGHHQRHGKPGTVLADIGPLAALRALQLRLVHEDAKTADRLAVFLAQLAAARLHLLGQVEHRRALLADHLLGAVAQQAFRAAIEHADGAFQVGGDDRHLGGRLQYVVQQQVEFAQLLGALAHLFFEAGVELENARLGGFLHRDVAHGLRQAGQYATGLDQRGDRSGNVHQAAVLAMPLRIEVADRLAGRNVGEDASFFLKKGFGHDQFDQRMADGLLRGVAEDPFCAVVPADHRAIE